MVENVLQGLFGGVLIGIAASLMLIFNGRAASVSGIYNGVLQFFKGDVAWRVYFILGLYGGGLLIAQFISNSEEASTPIRSLSAIAIGGILVGFGTVMGTGCTSGHGFCGLSRLSRRSLVAFISFLLSGFATATILHMLTTAPGGQ